MHPFVQKWTTTTFPFWSASLSGLEFSQTVTPVNSGAGIRGLSPLKFDVEPGFKSGAPPRLWAAHAPRISPNSATAAVNLVFILEFLFETGDNATTPQRNRPTASVV